MKICYLLSTLRRSVNGALPPSAGTRAGAPEYTPEQVDALVNEWITAANPMGQEHDELAVG